jgi:hypothetical protein
MTELHYLLALLPGRSLVGPRLGAPAECAGAGAA